MSLSWKSWLSNEGGKHLVLLFWLAINVLLFWKTFTLYYYGPQYYYLHRMLGLGLCISRASASVLNMNCSLILLPMCRTVLAFLRGSQKIMCRKARRLLDKSKTFHVTCGFAICVFSVVHVAAHMVNAFNFSLHYSEDFPALNVAHYRDEDPRKMLFTTLPGVTGFFMVLVLFLMCTSSSYSLRFSNYDIFWYTHNLFIIFYILLFLHVTGGVLKYQVNINDHPPGCIGANKTLVDDFPVPVYPPKQFAEGYTKPEHGIENNLERVCSEAPRFRSNVQETWLWVSGPLCLYCVEKLYRIIWSNKPATIISVNSHPSDVIEIRMVKDNFRARPGQYIVLHCPSVSTFESHPFTLTTNPTENRGTFGVHLRVLGDWTERFRELLLSEPHQNAEILPILQQRKYPKYDWKQYKLRRLYFIWVCREIQSFHWFADLLCTLHNKLWQENRPDYLNIQLYLSRTDGIQNLLGEKYQALNSRLIIGKPRLKLLFEEIAKCNKKKCVGVFCCGPSELSKELHKLSNQNSSHGTKFEYNKESFC
ncbi:NADPH oxidase 4 isoform X2 [Callorhinchus milii]|uniref:NADPH oxidase 4 isoform X2 n=1 Tax=Callorhinchus milii TaxID=7868 RepID=UPI0004574B86|nr:NADPH oxidase 4 isoform X2 [Callorhinchus milii]|eukprot:gi/632937631/ref/XP_007900474.1/ PREDICTED: NADPH oxidase 4 isoform X2 [Callorhinchus milii]